MIKNVRRDFSMLSPSLIWLLLFLLIPLGLIAVISFTTNLGFGGILYEFSTDAYRLAFSSLYAKVIWYSIFFAGICTILGFIIVFLLFYFIVHSVKLKNSLLLIVMVPFWTNFLILLYALIVL